MKPRGQPTPDPESAAESAQQIKEAAAAYVIRRDVVSVREAKDQLSGLLQRVALGEEIVITSDGRPKAMLVRFRPHLNAQPFQADREWLLKQPLTPDSSAAIRAERDAEK